MDQGLLKNYFSSRHSDLVKHLKKINKKNAEEQAHKLRVAIKKIRFLLKLVHDHNPQIDSKELFRPYKKIFRQSAKVREVQIKRRILKYYLSKESFHKIEKLIDGEENKQLKKFLPKAHGFTKEIKEIKPKILKAVRHTYAFSESEYAGEFVDKIGSRYQSYLTTEELHESRKLLKELIYCVVLSPELKKYISKLFEVPIAEKLQNEIGLWHDNAVALRQIFEDDPALAKIPTDEKKVLADKIRKNVERHSKTIQRLIKKITQPVVSILIIRHFSHERLV